MHIGSETEIAKVNEPEGNAPNAPEGSMPEAEANSAVANFRQGFFTESRYGLLLAMGEEPKDYQRMMESLLEDLQPRQGLESHLVEQMGETFWHMRRAQRMRDGLALRSIQRKVQGEELVASMQASKAFDALEPFEHLKEALSRRGAGPTAAEIDEFVETRKDDTSEKMQEFIRLLKSLKEPMEDQERKAACKQARKQLGERMEAYQHLAWRFSRQSEKVQSPENLAALMAPADQTSVHLQKMEDFSLRRLWRLINAFEKVRQGVLQKKEKNHDRTRNVYENK
ncbi:MAG TPA: hypothetical protein VKO18_02885 [Terriglobia bacterium]|nr:hypothetical protein [Terriglobia bacterium]